MKQSNGRGSTDLRSHRYGVVLGGLALSITLASCAQGGDTTGEEAEETTSALQTESAAGDDTTNASTAPTSGEKTGDGEDEGVAEFSLPHAAGSRAVHLTDDEGGFRLDGSTATFIFPSGSEFEFDAGAPIELESYSGGSTYFSGPNGQFGITREGEEITFSGNSNKQGMVVVDLATGEGFVSKEADGVKTSYKQESDGTYRCTTEEDGRSTSYQYYADGRPQEIQLPDTTVTFDKKGNTTVIGDGWDPDAPVSSSALGGGCAIDSNLVFVMEGDMLFDTNRHDLTTKSEPLIDDLLYYLKNSGATKVRIVGHTDSGGTSQDNQALGQRRAEAIGKRVGDILDGVEVVTDSMGEENPIVSNATKKGKAKNRRVEVTVLEKDD